MPAPITWTVFRPSRQRPCRSSCISDKIFAMIVKMPGRRNMYISLILMSAVFLLLSPQNKALASERETQTFLPHTSHQMSCADNSCLGMHGNCATHCAKQSEQHESASAVMPSQQVSHTHCTPASFATPRHSTDFDFLHASVSNRAPPTLALLRSIMKRE